MSFTQDPHNYVAQSTLQYSTFLKRTVVEALQDAFKLHPTKMVKNAKVDVDFTQNRWALPGIIIKFFEREMRNAGVGHYEYLPSPQNVDPNNPTYFIKYYHRIYKGDIAFEIWARSSTDRDLVRDALIEVLAMNDATPMGVAFQERLYQYLNQTPYGLWHYPVLNTDLITGYGEESSIAPWAPEDALMYKVTYRVPIFGEFYSATPPSPQGGLSTVSEVDLTVDLVDSYGTQLEEDFYTFTGWPAGAEEI